jgi:hypothetical protein
MPPIKRQSASTSHLSITELVKRDSSFKLPESIRKQLLCLLAAGEHRHDVQRCGRGMASSRASKYDHYTTLVLLADCCAFPLCVAR